ncbi:MAG: HipA domain-containing protein [Bacteroidota bacterium]
MTSMRCLYCYRELASGETDFHPSCSKKMFDKPTPPELPYSEDQMIELAVNVIRSRSVVTGVQPKLSLDLQPGEKKNSPQRFTIVGLWGNFILKPPSEHYPFLPEIEDCTMHLATAGGIETVPHSLIRMSSGALAYITKRIDRTKNDKIPMEDMCQLTGRLTEHKYHGSHEQIAKTIRRFSTYSGLDIVNFYEQVIFCFLTGNADMHLKNFSMIHRSGIGHRLAPAYDLVATALVVSGDDEELALTLNGKKKKLNRNDFVEAMKRAGMNEKATENIFDKFRKAVSQWHDLIENSFLSALMKERYHTLIDTRRTVLEL